MRITPVIAATLAAGLLLAGCEDAPAAGSGATVVDDAAAAAAEVADEEPAAAAEAEDEVADDEQAEAVEEEAAEAEDDADEVLGTRESPLPLGTVIELDDWSVSVTEVTADATDVVMAENEFNDPPADGRQFVLFRAEATYEGDDSGDPWDLSWAIVGAGGNTFGGSSTDDYCGVIPDAFDEKGETFPGGSVEGNVCLSVPGDQVDGATILVEDTFSFEDTRVFFAVS
jgi:hypothetical protein